MGIAVCHLVLALSNVSGPAIPYSATGPARPDISKLQVLKQLSNSFEEIAQRSGQGVVQIFARTYTPLGSENSSTLLTSENSTSSGVVVSADGYILTNAHAIRGAHNIRVHMTLSASVEARHESAENLDRSLSATIVGVDEETDLAVIKVKKSNLPFLTFADSDQLKQGQLVLALGNPLGLEDSVSLGVVSVIARQLKPDDPMVYIQTDAPINPGNSGGPLLDADGRVVGTIPLFFPNQAAAKG
jgi:serine protease Do